MPAIRIALIALGVGLWVPLAIIAGCKGGVCGHAWDAAPGSARYELYDLLCEHRVLVAAVFCVYGAAVIASFRSAIAAACTRGAVLRAVGLVAIAIAIAAAGVLLSFR